MVVEVMVKILEYIFHVVKGFLEILIGKEEFIYDAQGKIMSKLPSKRKQVLVFLKNFLKEPVCVCVPKVWPTSEAFSNSIRVIDKYFFSP